MQTLELAIFLQFFLGLVAAVNPVGIMPVFVSLTGHMTPEEKNKTATTANVAVAIILIISLLLVSCCWICSVFLWTLSVLRAVYYF